MKANWLPSTLLLLFTIAAHLPAQQIEPDRKLLAEIRANAEKGDAQSQYEFGGVFFFGNFGVAKDEAEAVRWYRKAAEQNSAPAQYNLGFCYANGQGVAKDHVEAVKWWRKAAEKNDGWAQNNLGFCYANGDGVAKDDLEAVKWYRKAAEQNDAVAQFNLGVRYDSGRGVAQDKVEAAKWYRKAAEQDFVVAQHNLGGCYLNGEGVPKDEAQAVKWYRKAAEQNHAGSQNNLGSCYANGEGVAKDEAEAVKWCRKAAEQNDAQAQFNLGRSYAKGRGVPKDNVEAVNWWHKAAEQNNAWAQNNLGSCYTKGEGITKDDVEAAKWYRRAAEQGLAVAQNNFGSCLLNGEGVRQDMGGAVKWYRKAAEQGDDSAQYNLGVCYANGDGLAKNCVETHKWWTLASAQGHVGAKKSLAVIEPQMTNEQIAEAQRLSRKFRASKTPEPIAALTRDQILDLRRSRSGTSFFISEDGFLITSEHVVKNATQIRLVTSAGTISAKVVKVDAANDLALLKVEGRFAALPVAASRGVKLGGTAATVGFPNIGLQGFAPKLARGEIASLSGAQDDARYFQISVPVQPGNSGGALVDERGNVVGVVSAKLNARAALSATGALPENVNYAVKSSYLLSFLESVPEVVARLREPESKERKFEDVVRSAEQAAVLVLVY